MTTTKRPKSAPKPTAPKTTPSGRRIVAGLRDLVATMEAGGMAAVQAKFTTHKPVLPLDTPSATVADVADIRRAIGATPLTFAALLGVDANTLREWERGKGVLPGVAARFLAEIRRDPAYWQRRLTADAPRTAGPAPA